MSDKKPLQKTEILRAIDDAFRELESQKYALDQSAIVAITDVRGNIIYVNEQFCHISKYTEKELLGQNHRIINSGYHPKEFFVNMWMTIASGKVWKDNIKNKAKDGSFYWVTTTITPYLNEKGQPHMFVSIRFDITKQKQMEQELEEKLNERTVMLSHLSDQNKQLEDFCHIISHNLRAPLANLSLLADMIEESKATEEKLLYITKLRTVTHSLQETFEELVEATQVRMDYEVKQSSINLEECVERIVNTLQGDIIESKAVIRHDFSEVPTIVYPKKYIDSILFNLLSNAIKYRSTERPCKIEVKTYIHQQTICLSVKDNGLGIDLEKHGSKLFKLRKVFHKHPDAKGFGLFITKTHVEAMRGKITAYSTVDEGTEFIIELYKTAEE
jgi:PAS domain S-box-containing protein